MNLPFYYASPYQGVAEYVRHNAHANLPLKARIARLELWHRELLADIDAILCEPQPRKRDATPMSRDAMFMRRCEGKAMNQTGRLLAPLVRAVLQDVELGRIPSPHCAGYIMPRKGEFHV